jgi:hypothetical protein
VVEKRETVREDSPNTASGISSLLSAFAIPRLSPLDAGCWLLDASHTCSCTRDGLADAGAGAGAVGASEAREVGAHGSGSGEGIRWRGLHIGWDQGGI